jgi:ribosomal protein S18 acetylase RimI-like enzyme
MYSIEVVHHADDAFIRDLLKMRSETFPKGWEYADAEKYYREMIEDIQNINIVTKEKDKILGYMLAIPHNKVVDELKEDDPLMKEDPKRLYIETMEIHPYVQKTGLFIKMVDEFFQEAGKRGFKKFSMHVRVDNGVSSMIQRCFLVTEIHRIENWPYYNHQEPTDYILVTYKK